MIGRMIHGQVYIEVSFRDKHSLVGMWQYLWLYPKLIQRGSLIKEIDKEVRAFSD
jgi:hypothetical protein